MRDTKRHELMQWFSPLSPALIGNSLDHKFWMMIAEYFTHE